MFGSGPTVSKEWKAMEGRGSGWQMVTVAWDKDGARGRIIRELLQNPISTKIALSLKRSERVNLSGGQSGVGGGSCGCWENPDEPVTLATLAGLWRRERWLAASRVFRAYFGSTMARCTPRDDDHAYPRNTTVVVAGGSGKPRANLGVIWRYSSATFPVRRHT